MRATKIILIIVLTLLLASCEDTSTSPEKTVSLNGQTYTNGVLGFSVSAPEDWQLEENVDVADMKALLVGSKLISNGIAPSFNIISSFANGMQTPEDLLISSQTYISSLFDEVIFEKSNIFTAGGFNCAEHIYSFIYNGISLKQKQVLFLCSDKTSIAITFTANAFNFDMVADDFDIIISSLRML